MKTIVAGSRGITDIHTVMAAIQQCPWVITQIVSGNARGVDQLAEECAMILDIPLAIYPADWDRYGKSAGYKRNTIMAMKSDALIAIWDGHSVGTEHMIDTAKRYFSNILVIPS